MNKEKYILPKFTLENGIELSNVVLAFQTFGEFHSSKKIVWVCHALTGDTDVFSWWQGLFGENQLFNSDEYFIICANAVGSPYGSSSPLTIEEQHFQYRDFPLVTTRDLARLYDELKTHLCISKIDILIGASLGGQQALEWSVIQPELFERLILVATNAKHSSYGIAFNESQRMAIEGDVSFWINAPNGGQSGMSIARSIALLSYRSYVGYQVKQQETTNEKVSEFRAASYQNYQGQKLKLRFNAYSYYALTKTMDAHNIGRNRGALEAVLQTIQARTLIIGVDSDILFPLEEQLFLKNHIPKADLVKIKSKYGHDGFLIETDQLTDVIGDFLENELKHYKPTILKSIY